MAEEGYFLDFLIGPLASVFEVLGIEPDKAVKYAKTFIYGGLALIALVAGLRIYRFIRG